MLGRRLAEVQHPSAVGQASRLPSVPQAGCKPALRRRRWALAAAVLLCLGVGLGLAEATGTTQLTATVIRIFTPSGTLIVEVDDPAVKVAIEGDGGLVITGAGPQEVRLRPGSYRVHADKDGKPIPVEKEVVTIKRGDKQVVSVRLEANPSPAPLATAKPEPKLFVVQGSQGVELRKFATLAEAAAACDEALRLFPKDALLWSSRGYLHAISAQWEQAVADFNRARELKPEDATLWYYHAVACLAADKKDEYRRVCAGMMQRFGDTKDHDTAARILYTCVTLPDAIPDRSRLVPLGVIVGSKDRVLMAALYRAGRFDEVVERLRGLKVESDLWLSPFLAMAYHRLGRTEDARRVLDAILAEKRKQFPDGKTPPPQNWNSWVEIELLSAEAEELMKKESGVRDQEADKELMPD